MKEVIVHTNDEYHQALKEAMENGMKAVSASTVGLEGSVRLTFVPDSAFEQPTQQGAE